MFVIWVFLLGEVSWSCFCDSMVIWVFLWFMVVGDFWNCLIVYLSICMKLYRI